MPEDASGNWSAIFMNQTDMALELADLCDRLYSTVPERGEDFLAGHFDVEKWSAEFFQIIFSITERTNSLERILVSEGVSKPVLDGARVHLASIRSAFDSLSLRSKWLEAGAVRLGPSHSSPIRMISGVISRNHSFPLLSDEEINDLREVVGELIDWLEQHQLSDRDFIRECIIDGLRQFLFRLDRLKWLGWGYSVESLKDVIMAYFALERGLDVNIDPVCGAAIQKIGSALKRVYGFTGAAKEATETSDWALAFFKVAIKFGTTGGGGYVAGLLS